MYNSQVSSATAKRGSGKAGQLDGKMNEYEEALLAHEKRLFNRRLVLTAGDIAVQCHDGIG